MVAESIDVGERLVLLADIHGNLAALEAVLEDVDIGGSTSVISLGDIVGYGARPGACIERLQQLEVRGVSGNHDAAVTGELAYRDRFNLMAVRGIEFTKAQLESRHVQFLEDQPRMLEAVPAGVEILFCHGSPEDPLMDYVSRNRTLFQPAFEVSQDVIGVGHTHQPICLYSEDGTYDEIPFDRSLVIETVHENGTMILNSGMGHEIEGIDQLLINPGSVGQPRDGREQAAYMIVEKHGENRVRWAWRRVAYDIDEAAEQIREAELNDRLAERLYQGQ